MNDAPRREPESIVKVCSQGACPPRLIAVAATGDPDNTK